VSLFQFRRPGANHRRVRNEKGSGEGKRRRRPFARIPRFEPLEQRQLLSVVAGRVWLDSDADGVQGPAELGQNGVTVNLYQHGVVDPIATTTTGGPLGAGRYLFDPVAGGNYYYVEVVAGAGYSITRSGEGGEDLDSDVHPFTGRTQYPFLLPPGGERTIDAGLVENFATVVVDDGDPLDGDADVVVTSLPFDTTRAEFDVRVSNVTAFQEVGGYIATVSVDPPNAGVTFAGAVQADDPLFPPTNPEVPRNPSVFYAGVSGRKDNSVADDLKGKVVPVYKGDGLFTLQFDVAAGTSGEFDILIDSLQKPLKFSNENGDNIWNVDVINGKLTVNSPEPRASVDEVIAQREGDSGEMTRFAFMISASGLISAQEPLVVEVATLPGTATPGGVNGDYTPVSTQLTFTDTQPQTVFVYVKGDDAQEPHERFTVIVRDASDPTKEFDTGTGVILDDDYAESSIDGRVWEDVDGNGIQDGNEEGLGGITVNLHDELGGGPAVASTVTGTDGSYAFDNLIAGNYYVEFVAEGDLRFVAKDAGDDDTVDSDADTDGWTDRIELAMDEIYYSAPPIEHVSHIDAGMQQLAFTMIVDDVALPVPTEPTTQSVDVYFELPTDVGDFQPRIASYNSVILITPLQEVLPDGLSGPGVKLETTPTIAQVHSPVFSRAPSYSEYDPDPSKEGIQLFVADYMDGAGEGVAIENNDGAFAVEFTVQPGVKGVYKVEIFEQLIGSPSGRPMNVITRAGQIIVGPASVSGQAWGDEEDENGKTDGIRQGQEVGVQDVTVELYRQSTGGSAVLVDMAQTKADGSYEFNDLLPVADYYVKFVRPDNTYRFTAKDMGTDDTQDSDANPSDQENPTPDELATHDPNLDVGQTETFTLGYGEGIVLDAGLRQLKFEVIVDVVAVRHTDAGGYVDVYFEVPVELQPSLASYNAVVSIYPEGSDTPAVDGIRLDLPASLAANPVFPGEPSFSSYDPNPAIPIGSRLFVGDYLSDQGAGMEIADQAGMFRIDFTITDPNRAEAVGKYNLRIDELSLTDASGKPLVNYIAKPGKILVNPVSVGDRVWNDVNSDGIQNEIEPGVPEPGMEGIDVSLFKWGDDPQATEPVATDTTNEFGDYWFTDLEPGDYFLLFHTPLGYRPTTQNSGDDSFDSDIDADGKTGKITLGSGVENSTIDAGFDLLKFKAIIDNLTIPSNPAPGPADVIDVDIYFEVPDGLIEPPYLAAYNSVVSVSPRPGSDINGAVTFLEQATATQTHDPPQPGDHPPLFGDHDPQWSLYGVDESQLFVYDSLPDIYDTKEIVQDAGLFALRLEVPRGTYGTFDLSFDELLLIPPSGPALTNYIIEPGWIEITPPAPVAEFSIVGDAQGNETDGVQFTVELSEAVDAETSVLVSFAPGGSAAEGVDYDGTWQETLVFAAQEISKNVTVPITPDSAVEANETFIVQITNPSPGTEIDGTKAEATGTILNDDQAALTIEDVTLPEGGQGLEILGTPPASVVEGENEDDSRIVGFQESTDQPIPLGGLDVDFVSDGTEVRFGPSSPPPGTIPEGSVVDSWIFHFDPIGDPIPGVSMSGAIQFSEDILGVILSSEKLDTSDLLFGNPLTAYPAAGTEGVRGMETQSTDRLILLADNRTLLFDELVVSGRTRSACS